MRKRVLGSFLVCAALCFTAWAHKPSKDELWKLRRMSRSRNSVTVMTRNLYFGTDVDYVMAGPQEEIPIRVAQAVEVFYSTDIGERVKAFADEIARGRPHLVGLQEVAIIRILDPATYEVLEEYDFLALLEAALADRGLHYRVVGAVQDVEITVPMLVDMNPYGALVQLVDRDVVLARRDVRIFEDDVFEENYSQFISFMGIPILRGYVALRARVGRKEYWFANTHLEPAHPGVKQDQAAELMTFLEDRTAEKNLPVIIVGDLNAPAPEDPTYQSFLAAGYVDAWTRNRVRPRVPGFTNPHDSDLRNTEIKLNQRIDLILVRKQLGMGPLFIIGPVWAWVVGDELEDRILNPDDGTWMWPSDHAGVIALLRIPYRRGF